MALGRVVAYLTGKGGPTPRHAPARADRCLHRPQREPAAPVSSPRPASQQSFPRPAGVAGVASVSIQLVWGPRWEWPFGGWRASLLNTQASEVYRGPINLQENESPVTGHRCHSSGPWGIFNPCYHKWSPQTLRWPTSTVHWSETLAPATPGSMDPTGTIYFFAGGSTRARRPRSTGSGHSSRAVEPFLCPPVEARPAWGLRAPHSATPELQQRGFPGSALGGPTLLPAGFQTREFH